MTKGLADDPKLLQGPKVFAARVNAGDLDLDDAYEKGHGFRQFATTFIPQVLDAEFGVEPGGFPEPSRAKAAELAVDHEGDKGAQRLLRSFVDICDLEIDLAETYGSDDEEDGEFNEELIDAVVELLEAFGEWLPVDRLPALRSAAVAVSRDFAAAAKKVEAR
jgi:hypothetical protein